MLHACAEMERFGAQIEIGKRNLDFCLVRLSEVVVSARR